MWVTGGVRVLGRWRVVQQGRRDVGRCGKWRSQGISAARRFADAKSAWGMMIDGRRRSIWATWRAEADNEVFGGIDSLSDSAVVEVAVRTPVDEGGEEQQ
ncbi:MAG: hypothetical protein RL215_2849 [Planctomycetota bacterium]